MKTLIITFSNLKFTWKWTKLSVKHHGVTEFFPITYCQITQASDHWICVEKRKESPTWAFPPSCPGWNCANTSLGSVPAPSLLQSLLWGWAAGAPKAAEPRAGFQQQLCLCSFSLSLLAEASLLLGVPFSWVTHGHSPSGVSPAQPGSLSGVLTLVWVTHSPWCPAANPFHHDIVPAVSQMFPAADGSFQALQPPACCASMWAPCSFSSQLMLAGTGCEGTGHFVALFHTAALLHCLASIRNSEFLERNLITALITSFVWGNFVLYMFSPL